MARDRETVEIGGAKELLLDKLYVFHTRGDPVEEARILKELMHEHGFSQKDLAVELDTTQAQVSRLLSILTLEPEFLDRMETGELRFSTANELTKLPREERMRFLKGGRISLKEVVRRRREIQAKSAGLDAPTEEGAEMWWASLPQEERIRIYSLHRRARGGSP